MSIKRGCRFIWEHAEILGIFFGIIADKIMFNQLGLLLRK